MYSEIIIILLIHYHYKMVRLMATRHIMKFSQII